VAANAGRMRLRGLLLASTLLVACSSPGTTTTISPSTLRFDLAADPTTLNPLFEHPDVASVEQQVARLAFEPFVDLDANGRPEPALLAVIPTVANGGISRDGQTIVYRLRSNVRWSDGVGVLALTPLPRPTRLAVVLADSGARYWYQPRRALVRDGVPAPPAVLRAASSISARN